MRRLGGSPCARSSPAGSPRVGSVASTGRGRLIPGSAGSHGRDGWGVARYDLAMPPRLVKKSATLAIRDDGTLKIAVVADTHSQPHAAIREHLAAIAPDAILHAGDIGDAAVIDRLAETAPVFVVRGNIDTRAT